MKSDAAQPPSSPNETLLPQEPRYTGTVEVELAGLALMHQRRTLSLTEPLGRSAVETLALATERNHVWDYQGMQEDTICVTILSQPQTLPESALAGTTDPIIAHLGPDGCPGITFDASFWLCQADAQELRDLRNTDFAGNYLSDELAHAARACHPQVEAVLAYCEALDCGFTCALPVQATEAWLLRYRPDIGPDMLEAKSER